MYSNGSNYNGGPSQGFGNRGYVPEPPPRSSAPGPYGVHGAMSGQQSGPWQNGSYGGAFEQGNGAARPQFQRSSGKWLNQEQKEEYEKVMKIVGDQQLNEKISAAVEAKVAPLMKEIKRLSTSLSAVQSLVETIEFSHAHVSRRSRRAPVSAAAAANQRTRRPSVRVVDQGAPAAMDEDVDGGEGEDAEEEEPSEFPDCLLLFGFSEDIYDQAKEDPNVVLEDAVMKPALDALNLAELKAMYKKMTGTASSGNRQVVMGKIMGHIARYVM